MNYYLDVFSEEQVISLDSTGYIHDVDVRAAACEDDAESTCPWVGMMPAESDHEGGSPLDFSVYGERGGRNLGMRLVARPGKGRRRRLKKHEARLEQQARLARTLNLRGET